MKTQQETDNARIETAIYFLIKNYRSRPGLAEVAEQANLSRYHFQRMFSEWVGVTPKQFAQYLSVEHAKKILRETRATLSDATARVGLSATSRLHDLFVNIEGMTPGEYRNGGESLTINYSFADTPFGTLITGSTAKGICYMSFADEGTEKALECLKSNFPNARYEHATDENQQRALTIFGRDWSNPGEIKLHLKGTAFRIQVWKTLLQIPAGGLATYSDIARESGHEGAQRAVGTALGDNPVVFLIPCHRVIKSSGIIGNYRYGTERKNAMIGWEAAGESKAGRF